MTNNLPKIIELDFTYLELHLDFVISSIKEGVVFDNEHREQLFAIFDTYYKQKNFGYISDRKFDYTINPTSYLKSQTYKNLVGYAVHCYSDSNYATAMFEKRFYDRAFAAFYSLEECKNWVKKLI